MATTALVTGGSGFIAKDLIAALLQEGWGVRACGRRPRPHELPEAVEYRQVDQAGPPGHLGSLVRGISHIFHLAGASSSRSSEEEMHRSNVVATENLAEAASAAQPDVFLHMSSTSVYGEQEQLPTPVPETVEPKPSRGYGKAKWMAEQAVWRWVDAGLPAIVLRPVSVHGPGATKLLASAMLDVALERFAGHKAVLVHEVAIEQRLVHLRDVVAACIHLARHEAARGKAYNLAMPVYPTSHDVAGLLAGEFAMGFELSPDPDCGPTSDERSQTYERMRSAGMTGDILFTPERFRFMRKANRNNRVDLQALLDTGFRIQEADLGTAVAELARWYGERRWII